MACANLDGELAPFCGPANGAEFETPQRIQVRWDTSYFKNASNDLIRIQANYTSEDGSSTDAGFASPWLRTYTGTYGWQVKDDVLQDGQSSMKAQLYIVTSSEGGTEGQTIPGPEVKLVAPSGGSGSGSSSGVGMMVNPAVIVVPILVGMLIIGLVAFYLLKRRRNPNFSLRGMFQKNEGYGVRKSKGQRTTTTPATTTTTTGTSMQMGNMAENGSSPSPAVASGRNVFREEMMRQEKEAQP